MFDLVGLVCPSKWGGLHLELQDLRIDSLEVACIFKVLASSAIIAYAYTYCLPSAPSIDEATAEKICARRIVGSLVLGRVGFLLKEGALLPLNEHPLLVLIFPLK